MMFTGQGYIKENYIHSLMTMYLNQNLGTIYDKNQLFNWICKNYNLSVRLDNISMPITASFDYI